MQNKLKQLVIMSFYATEWIVKVVFIIQQSARILNRVSTVLNRNFAWSEYANVPPKSNLDYIKIHDKVKQ